MKFLKNKKTIILIILLAIGLISLGSYLLFKNQNSKDNLNKTPHSQYFTAYIKINPLVKFNFKATYECNNEEEIEVCQEYSTIINEVYLLNDEAKEIYQDIDFKNKSLEEGISILINEAIDAKVSIDKILITTNMYYSLDVIKDKLNNKLPNITANLVFNYEKELDEDKIIQNNTTKKYNINFDSDGGSKVDTQIIKENGIVTKPQNPTKKGYTFLNWTLNNQVYDFNTRVTKDITLKATWTKIEDSTSTSSSSTSEAKPTPTLKTNEYYATKDGKVHKYTFTFDKAEDCHKSGDGVAYDTVYPIRPYFAFGCDEIKDANNNTKWGVFFYEQEDVIFYY